MSITSIRSKQDTRPYSLATAKSISEKEKAVEKVASPILASQSSKLTPSLTSTRFEDMQKISDSINELILAIKEGNLKKCEALLNKCDPLANAYLVERRKILYSRNFFKYDLENIDFTYELDEYSDKTPLIVAAKIGNVEIFKSLYAQVLATTNYENSWFENTLYTAIYYKRSEIVALLCSNEDGIKSIKQSSLLVDAAKVGDKEIFDLLLHIKLDPFQTKTGGLNAMHMAAGRGNVGIIAKLVQYTKLLDSKCNNGMTPLMYAAKEGKKEACEMLLKYNADPFVTTRSGWNALHEAAEAGHSMLIPLFPQLIHTKTSYGCTPLMLALSKGREQASLALINASSDLLVVDEDGSNAMHWVARHGMSKLIDSIPLHLINSKNMKGLTPLNLAEENGHKEIFEKLLKYDIYKGENSKPALSLSAAALEEMQKISQAKAKASEESTIKINLPEDANELLQAINEGDFKKSEALLNKKVQPKDPLLNADKVKRIHVDSHGYYALLASRYNLDSIYELKCDATPLITAVKTGNIKIFTLLYEKACRRDCENIWFENTLYAAIYCKRLEIVRMLCTNPRGINSLKHSSLLSDAVLAGNKETFDLLMQVKLNPSEAKINGKNALHFAAQRGNVAIVTKLIKDQTLLDSQCNRGMTPLMYAVEGGHNEIIEILLKANAKPDKKDKDGNTVLHIAVRAKKHQVIPLFSSYQHVLDLRNFVGKTALSLASEGEDENSLNALLKLTPDQNKVHKIKSNKSVLKHEVSVEDRDCQADLMVVLRNGNISIAEKLLKTNPNKHFGNDNNGYSVMHWAAYHGMTTIIPLLPRAYLHLKTNDLETPLMLAAKRGKKEACEVLLNHHVDCATIDKNGWNALHWAAHEGHSLLFPLFPKLINTKTSKSYTPFMLALRKGHQEASLTLIKTHADSLKGLPEDSLALIKANEDLLFVDENGWNAMHWAVHHGMGELIPLLPRQLINSKNKKDFTPLMMEAEKGNYGISELLITLGANVNAKPNSKVSSYAEFFDVAIDKKNDIAETVLMLAFKSGSERLVELLLKVNADPSFIDEKGWNAMHWAAHHKMTKVIPLLPKELCNSFTHLNETPLILALKNDRSFYDEDSFLPGYLQELFERSNLNLADNNGWNLMHWAAENGWFPAIKYVAHLIISKTNGGITPHMLAVKSGQWEFYKWLIKHQPDVSAQDENGWNVMDYAAKYNNSNGIELLPFNLFNSKTKDNKTALMITREKNSQLLLKVASEGQKELCKVLISSDVELFVKDKDGCNVMHWAARHGMSQVIPLLPKELFNSKNNQNETPLLIALKYNHRHEGDCLPGYLQDLIKNSNLTLEDNDGQNAMHWAARNGWVTVAEQLPKHLRTSKTKKGITPLMLAVQSKNEKFYKWLLTVPHDVVYEYDENHWSVMHYAASSNNSEVIKLLPYTLFNSITKDHKTPLMVAAEKGCYEVCKSLLLYEASAKKLWTYNDVKNDVRLMHSHLLLGAASEGREQLCKVLIKSDVDLFVTDLDGGNVLDWVISRKMFSVIEMRLEIFKSYLEKIVDPNDFRIISIQNMLFEAVENENLSRIKILLAIINMKHLHVKKNGSSLLAIATKKGNLEVCNMLLNAGLKIEKSNSEGRNCLHIAAILGHIELVRRFTMVNKELVNSADPHGMTPMMLAISQYSVKSEVKIEIIKILLASDYRLHAMNNRRMNVLHYAVIEKEIEIVRLLVGYKDKLKDFKQFIMATDKWDDDTPLMIAQKNSQKEIIELLRNAGALE